MNNLLKDERELLSKPGDTILETIEYMKMSQAELAERMGKTASKVNDLISGKEPITMATALQLEMVLGIDAQFWLNREINYREKLARLDQEEFLENCLDWLKIQPIKDLIAGGYLKSEKIGTAMASECLHFYAVASPEQWTTVYTENYASANYRKSQAHQSKIGAMAAFLRIGEIEMRKLSLKDYDKDKFKQVLTEAKLLVRNHPEDFALQLQKLCADAGVALIYSKCMHGAPVSGVTRWIAGKPLIQLTDRHKDYYHFWFTFFHEAGHVLLHGKKDVFMEEFDGYVPNKDKEAEADDFANKGLLQEDITGNFGPTISENDIRKAARDFNTDASIILARLLKLGLVKPFFGAALKRKVLLDYVINKSSVS